MCDKPIIFLVYIFVASNKSYFLDLSLPSHSNNLHEVLR